MADKHDLDKFTNSARSAISALEGILERTDELEPTRDAIKAMLDRIIFASSVLIDRTGGDGSYVFRDILADDVDNAFHAVIQARDWNAEMRRSPVERELDRADEAYDRQAAE